MRSILISMMAMPILLNHAHASSAPIPQEVASYIDGMKQTCKDVGGIPIAPSKSFLLSGHFRDPAHLDWAIDQGGFKCEGARSLFAGSGGSQVAVFAGLPNGSASQSFESGAYGMRMEHHTGYDILWLHVGGPLCGQSGFPNHADGIQCERPLVWDTKTEKFDFVPVSKVKILSRP